MNWLQKYLFKPSKLVGIECLYRQQQWTFHVVMLSYSKNNQLDIEKSVLSVPNIEEIKKIVEDNPVFLVINGQGLLHRAAPATSTLQELFPSAKNEDFYWQIHTWHTATIWSIIRKTMLEDCLQIFENQQIRVLDVHLGAFILGKSKALWQNVSIFNTETCILDWENSQFSNTATTQFSNLTLGSQTISEQALPALSAALVAGFAPSQIHADIPKIHEQRTDWFYKQAFKTALYGIVFFFFGLLLLNSYLFFEYQNSCDKLETEWDSKRGLVAVRDTLKSRIGKEQVLDKIPLASKTSWYADQLAASLPASIHLVELLFFPAEKLAPNAEKTWQPFTDNKIQLKGISTSSIYYQQWKKQLQVLPFVQKIDQTSYQDLDEQTTTFSLDIQIDLQ